ncbi:hypothetical protein AGOR_G00072200 [Albula goreensis]|uniref:Ig-like domain-containing protein n=1 Tax=Albula goreensis TaxID=1534307 RepID=A0A8T3DVY8_9TELE|nr:hypothetical protein AGOR_G00072200 [Albula goreensis]
MFLLCVVFYCITSSTIMVCKGSMEVLVGITGERITLPCSYNVRTHGRSSVCWGRDKVPMSKCSKTIISTDGDQVNFRESDRYQLLSGVTRGDVSLTIINVTENDSGIYGCRVEIPGPFNDLKTNFHLIILKGIPVTNPPVISSTTPVPLPDASQGEWTTAIPDTVSSDSPLVVLFRGQKNSQAFKENALRMAAVIFVLGLIIIVIIGLRGSWERKCRTTPLDHCATAVQVRN